jgi:uncharacterized protein YjiS (DUF1127 family)
LAKLCADGKETEMLYHDIKKQVAGWVRLRRAVHTLQWLDDRLLSDMGIERDAIPALVKGRRRP